MITVNWDEHRNDPVPVRDPVPGPITRQSRYLYQPRLKMDLIRPNTYFSISNEYILLESKDAAVCEMAL
jgi:hypothetical protein